MKTCRYLQSVPQSTTHNVDFQLFQPKITFERMQQTDSPPDQQTPGLEPQPWRLSQKCAQERVGGWQKTIIIRCSCQQRDTRSPPQFAYAHLGLTNCGPRLSTFLPCRRAVATGHHKLKSGTLSRIRERHMYSRSIYTLTHRNIHTYTPMRIVHRAHPPPL